MGEERPVAVVVMDWVPDPDAYGFNSLNVLAALARHQRSANTVVCDATVANFDLSTESTALIRVHCSTTRPSPDPSDGASMRWVPYEMVEAVWQ